MKTDSAGTLHNRLKNDENAEKGDNPENDDNLKTQVSLLLMNHFLTHLLYLRHWVPEFAEFLEVDVESSTEINDNTTDPVDTLHNSLKMMGIPKWVMILKIWESKNH